MKFCLALLCVIVSASAYSQDGLMHLSPTGMRYVLYTSIPGPKAKVGDVIKYNMLATSEQDSVFYDGFDKKEFQTDRIQKSAFAGDLMEGFMMMARGDSALFYISVDSMTKGHPDTRLKVHSYIKFTIKMMDIQSEADYGEELDKKQEERKKQGEIEKVKEPSLIADYIKANAPGAKMTDSGMYYVIEKEGIGPLPKAGDKITAHYQGTFLDGKEFYADHGEPFSFKLGANEVIPGWEQAFAMLKKGAKAKLIIPSKMAYGAVGGGDIIPPYSPLVFEVEVVNIEHQK